MSDRLTPEGLRRLFLLIQLALGGLFILALWWLYGRGQTRSNFRLREADRKKHPAGAARGSPEDPEDPEDNEDELAEARMKRNEPLRLSGIRIDGPAHEILGVPREATPEQIQRAYRELMKRYHPDRVGRPGTREWKDAQKIAEAINSAKSQLLSQSANPKRSGR
ncbi:MAG: J domain-containing protein [Oligoflexia bacterium]|nr:J domain-containing protein [Oligoflexia bacterium]